MTNTRRWRNLGPRACAALVCAVVPLCASAAGVSAEAQKAYTDLQTALTTAKSNGAVDATRSLNDQLKGYAWRTVYEFTQVQKTNLPGTRIALVALPNWSQLDAENYLVRNNLPFSGGPAPMNCPVAQLGGAAGRLIEVTLPGGGKTTLTDDQIKQKLNAVDATTGKTTWDSFASFRADFCATVFNLAQLSMRYKQYQAAQSNLSECKQNGLQITTWEKKQGFDFPNNKHRTAAVGGGILFKCGKADKNDSSQGIGYDSWFKWSDDEPVPLNILQTLAQSPPSNECPKTCIPMVKSGGVDAKFCVGLNPGYNTADATVSLKLGGSFRWDGRGKSLCSPTISVPAPFGIAASLDELADSAKQSLKDKMQSQLNTALAKDGNPAVKLQTLLGKLQ